MRGLTNDALTFFRFVGIHMDSEFRLCTSVFLEMFLCSDLVQYHYISFELLSLWLYKLCNSCILLVPWPWCLTYSPTLSYKSDVETSSSSGSKTVTVTSLTHYSGALGCILRLWWHVQRGAPESGRSLIRGQAEKLHKKEV